MVEVDDSDSDPGYHRDRGFQAYEARDYERSLLHFKRLQQLDPQDQYIWNYIDRAQGRSPRFREVLAASPRRRIYILGCGRSGTWLATALMTCFRDTFVLLQEVAAGRFTRVDAPDGTHVLKRESDSYETAHLIPNEVGLLYVLRFPLDVLVSPHVDIKYYIDPDRWLGEIRAFRRLYDEKRPNMYVLRYEDLVCRPDDEQSRVGNYFGLEVGIPFSRFHLEFQIDERIAKAMNGIRAPEQSSISRWQRDAEFREYCRKIWPKIEGEARWICDTFGYELPVFQ